MSRISYITGFDKEYLIGIFKKMLKAKRVKIEDSSTNKVFQIVYNFTD